MGCFNIKGFLSDLTISNNDDIVMFLCVKNVDVTVAFAYAPCEEVSPIALPIYGKYNDYGGITNIKKDANVKWLEEHVGKIDDIVEAFNECMDRFEGTINRCLASDNPYHPATSIRYVYENILKLNAHIRRDDRLCVIFEHQYFYDNYAHKARSYSVDVKKIYAKAIEQKTYFYKLLDTSADAPKCDYKHIVVDNYYLNELGNNFAFGNKHSYKTLCLYKGYKEEFVLPNFKEIKAFVSFNAWLCSAGKCFKVPSGQYSQEDYFDAEIQLCNDRIKLINQLKKKYED